MRPGAAGLGTPQQASHCSCPSTSMPSNTPAFPALRSAPPCAPGLFLRMDVSPRLCLYSTGTPSLQGPPLGIPTFGLRQLLALIA